MAGRHQLEGETGRRAIQMLKDVTAVLEKLGVKSWLDCGTLLGVVREQRLLPWDTDLDLGVTSEDAPKILAGLWRLRFAGFRVRVKRQSRDDGPLKQGDLRLFKLHHREWLVLRGPVALDIFVKYPAGDSYWWSEGRDPPVLKSVLAPHHDRLARLAFDGREFLAPADYEQYLTLRYGDWRTPVKQWNYRRDDLAIVPKG